MPMATREEVQLLAALRDNRVTGKMLEEYEYNRQAFKTDKAICQFCGCSTMGGFRRKGTKTYSSRRVCEHCWEYPKYCHALNQKKN